LAPPDPVLVSRPGAGATSADVAYHDALRRLFERTGGAWRLGLERVASLLSLLGDPQHAYPVFHVAGTNGKGSTVATLDALLRGGGLRVGRYTSPHLVDFCERIVVDGVPIPRGEVTSWLLKWEPAINELGATFFEATTAMALSWFGKQGVDAAILEVGLGGRLDATNVVQPVAAAVTQIGFDHLEYLGDTLPEIAGEKAGIFKAGAVAVVGETRAEIRDLLRAMAKESGATPVLTTGVDWMVTDVRVSASGTSFSHTANGVTRRLTTPLVGEFQAQNASVALAMLRGAGGQWSRIEQRAEELLPTVGLAGRFHRRGKWLFDVAHNADGAATVAANLQNVGALRPIVAVVSVLRDKDWRGILQSLAHAADRIVLTTAPTAPASRAWSLGEVVEWAEGAGIPFEVHTDFGDALSFAEAAGATVVVTGSFHTVGDAMERLQVDPLAR
jgi:dihydrofolate synthase / folylpolyglutamate synthase